MQAAELDEKYNISGNATAGLAVPARARVSARARVTLGLCMDQGWAKGRARFIAVVS